MFDDWLTLYQLPSLEKTVDSSSRVVTCVKFEPPFVYWEKINVHSKMISLKSKLRHSRLCLVLHWGKILKCSITALLPVLFYNVWNRARLTEFENSDHDIY